MRKTLTITVIIEGGDDAHIDNAARKVRDYVEVGRRDALDGDGVEDVEVHAEVRNG